MSSTFFAQNDIQTQKLPGVEVFAFTSL